jgi:hypothetical protein
MRGKDVRLSVLSRRRFLDQMNDQYAKLRADHVQWATMESERRDWDATLLDGLEEGGGLGLA